ncbi:MAG: shikimate kinase AroK [Gammaproteobacteria bacterium]
MKIQNIFLIGPMGAGKTTIGRCLAKELNLEFYDSDHEVESRSGADISWIFDIEGESGFRKREQQVIEEITQLNGIVLATGGGVVVTPENRTALAARGTVVYLKASIEQQIKRTQNTRNRPLLQTDDVEARVRALDKQREPLYADLADLTVMTNGESIRSVVTAIVNFLHE